MYLYLLIYKRQFSDNLFFFISVLEAILLLVIFLLLNTGSLKPLFIFFLFYLYKTQFCFLLFVLRIKSLNRLNCREKILDFFQDNFEFKIIGKIPEKPTIYVANYCSDRFENLACVLLPTTLTVVMNQNVNFHSKWVDTIETIDYQKNFQNVKRQVKNAIQKNSIFAYVSLQSFGIGKIRTGMFRIAHELDLEVTPVFISKIKLNYFGMKTNSDFFIKIGKSFRVENISEAVFDTRKFFLDAVH